MCVRVKVLSIVVGVLSVATTAYTEVMDAECNMVSLWDRLDCGFPTISKDRCQQRGCCFDDYKFGFIWCFFKPDQCNVDLADRKDCGFPGVTFTRCAKKGCCFDKNKPINSPGPQCYYSVNGNDESLAEEAGASEQLDQHPDVVRSVCEPGEEALVRCGKDDSITEYECSEMSCCYNSKQDSTPRCYKKPSDVILDNLSQQLNELAKDVKNSVKDSTTQAPIQRCKVLVSEATQCGEDSVTYGECHDDLNCCWTNSDVLAFHCYNPRD
jgi:hypothetical protein